MRPQSCKSKGRRFQQKVARSILDAFGHLEDDDVVSTSMGANGEDVRLSPKARTALPLSLECKCVEKLNIWSCVTQAAANAPPDTTPCVVFSRNRSPTYAVLPWNTLLSLYVQIGQGGSVPPRLQELLAQLVEFVPSKSPEEMTVKEEAQA